MDAMDPPGMERGVPSRRGSQGQSIDSVFSTLFPPPKVEKVPPASSAGLSRPRLLKVRRHFPSLRERPSVAVPAGFKDINEQRLNPFQRSAYPAASCSSQVSTSSSEPSTLMFGNSSNSSAAFANVDSCPSSVDHNAGGLKPGTRADCFRYGSSLEQCIAPDLRTPLAFGNTAAGKLPEEFQRLNMKHSWNEKYSQNVSGSFNSAQNVSGLFGERNHPPGSFSIRSSSRERKISAEKLPHHLRGLDINDPALENMHGDANSKFSTAGIQNPIGKANPSTGVFDFQATKTHSYDKEDADSVLPLDIRKLKIEVPGGDSGISKREGSYSSSQGDGIKKFSFIFGSNKWIAPHEEIETVNSQQNTSDQPERVKNEDTFKCTSGFAFRTPSDQGIGPDRVDDNGFDESTELPKKIQNLNIKDTVSRDGPSIASDRNFVFSSSKNFSGSYSGENITEAFNFGNESSVYKPSKGIPPIASQNNTADQSGHNKDGVSCNSATGFAFISPSEKIIVPDQGADDGLDEDAAGKLPEEIQKLRIKNPENEEKVRLDGGIPKTGGAGFVFTSSTTVSGLSTEENPDGLFFFGGKTTSSARYVSGSYGGTFFEEPVISSSGMGPGTSCSAGAVEDSNNSSKTKDSDYVSASSSFTSEGGKYFSAQSGDSYSSAGVFVFGSSTKGSKVNDQYGSFLSDRHDKPLDKLSEPDFPFGKAAVYESESSVDEGGVSVCSSGTNKTILEQSSQSCNPNANSVKPTIDEKAPSFSVLFDPVFQSSGHGSTFTGYGECGMPQENKSKREDPAKKGVSRHARARKRRGKLKETTMLFQGNSTGKSLREKSSQDKPDLDSQGGYSPMDFSPCHVEGPVGEVYSREASVASEESMTIEPSHLLNKINSSFSANGSTEDLGNVAMKSSNSVELLKEAYGGCGFPMDSCSNDLDGSGFTFGASSSARSSLLSSKHNQRRKFKAKVGQNGFVPASDPSTLLFPNLSGSSLLDGKKTQTEGPSARHRHESERKTTSHLKEGISPSPSQESERKTTTAQQACEKWRLRGNQAYADGDLYKAEEYYTRGVKSVSPDDTSLGCRRTLMLCYSNRAATLMSVGRIRDALSDCMMATDIDPGFFRAQLRAASCHLLLGETEEACNRFKKCLHGGCGSSLDEKFVFEASDGLHKVKLVADCMERASSLLQKGTAENAATVLQIIPDALSLSPYSESLIEMKAEALLMLHHYGELILLLDQTLDSAEKNSSRSVLSHAKAWRAYLKSRAYFCLGKLDEALAMIKDNRDKSDSFALLSATVSELLRLKVAGNTAFKSGKHSEAVEHYTAALTYNIESRPFTAVCFCNRAAAYQAMGQLTEAISDCSLAIALDPDYPKAISRIATLHEMIRDYSQAGKDLCRLISLLERKQEYEIGGGRPANHVNDIELARSRLAKVEEKARKEIPLDMYRILGVEASSDVAEIKKAYRKAALRHHPDKASQLLVRSESTDEKLRKEVADEVHRDADRLFKMIGEAYAVLSDPSKRRQYDAEEEIRKTLKGSSNVSGSSSTHHRYYYYKNDTGHYERGGDAWHMPFESSGRRSSGTYRTRRYY